MAYLEAVEIVPDRFSDVQVQLTGAGVYILAARQGAVARASMERRDKVIRPTNLL